MSNSRGSREKILLSARDLFYVVGYQSTSVDDILRVCGVAKSNFYYHFRTKDELALEVLTMCTADLEGTALKLLLDGDLDPCARIERFCESLIQGQSGRNPLGGCPFGNFAAALSIRDGDAQAERFRDAIQTVFAQFQKALTSCLKEGIESGAIRNDIPAEELAAMALAAVEGLLLMTRTHRSDAPLTRGLPVLRLLMRGD